MKRNWQDPILMLCVLLVISLTGVPVLGFTLRLAGGMFMAGWNYAGSLFV
jgi:hypothetical protein